MIRFVHIASCLYPNPDDTVEAQKIANITTQYSYENLSRLSSVDLQEHASTIKKELSNTTAGSPTNANGMRIKPNLLNYIGFTCLEQANSGPFADALIAKEIHKDFLYLITNGGTMEL
ncbi:unnamed protein product [Rotaria socialis]|uniref:Uncharacterized protein n=1 Tax=Rotaria socialis TaxID=392032 RepID=A0A817VWE5_9BILA|nr:unnamed protein product [Rotaria socialis]CAF4480886.1 unnamed protein product [Rotaria socialis]